MLDDLDAAQRWVDRWETDPAERARELSGRLGGLTASAHDEAGLITVTVDAGGSVTDLGLDERIREQPAARTAQEILATIRRARARLLARISDETARAYGQDNPLTESILAPYRERLGQ
jgi:hypothetical protein